ncbi:cation:dicarboxylase symporter family transporter [Streptomyces sp. NPDC005329]|uniref:cation:dicarboxylate symporter family transporter n=1 Tax=Streptomyces sp. NPDC005329 TaxID=3157034 RepID=UPI0033A0C634
MAGVGLPQRERGYPFLAVAAGIVDEGAAGVTGSGFIALAATLSAVPHVPVAALALIFGIDRFMSEARALTSLVGNGVATLAVACWEGELDEDRAKAVLRGEIPYAPTPAPSAVTAEPEPTETPVPTHAPVPAAS